ncbi:MAG: hypothetical protein ACXAAP_14815 [Candidatus Thorarchaeota archaeon]|jgi:hypothetical protein
MYQSQHAKLLLDFRRDRWTYELWLVSRFRTELGAELVPYGPRATAEFEWIHLGFLQFGRRQWVE